MLQRLYALYWRYFLNQRDATVVVIDFVRQQGPDEPALLRALKVLERRAEVLRLRHERRFATIPEDLFEEPITFSSEQILEDLHRPVCRPCGRKKRVRQSLCVTCFDALEPGIRKALWQEAHYAPAYCRAVRVLREALES